jgi:hypothetical protein
MTAHEKLPELIVTEGGVPCADQADGIRRFKEACARAQEIREEDRHKPSFPGTASMYAATHRLAVTEEWMRGWNACLDAIDRLGGFRRG